FQSRLFLGTGKFSSSAVMKESIEKSGTEMVTVALRRVDLNNPEDHILNYIDPQKYHILPNTSGARNAEEALRLARLSKAAGFHWLKLEVIPDSRYLLPDPVETLKAAIELVREGFIVLPYIQADPILCKKLEEAGCAAVMPLAAPIGSNKGIKTIDMLEIIIAQSNVPVVVDAGIGAPSHAALAMEMGADAVLVNTAIATAENPVLIAGAFKKAVEAGREGYLSGLPVKKETASASSPLTGFLFE
ncbi:MAG: thiazole synthase, partial [Spirochaetes bacterium GWB1_36_13]